MKSNVYRIIYEDTFHFYDYKFITVQAIKNIKLKMRKTTTKLFFHCLEKL